MNQYLALDTETFLMRQGYMAPHVVCVSWAWQGQSGLIHHTEAEAWLHEAFDSGVGLVGANMPYDMSCIGMTWPSLWPKIWQAYNTERVFDVLVRQKLQDLARGIYRGFRSDKGLWIPLNYSLDAVQHRYTKTHLDKSSDTWRLRYSELHPVPLDQWPEAAKTYAVDDAITTLKAFEGQEARALEDRLGSWYHVDQHAQFRADWWLHLASVVGIHTSADAVAKLKDAAGAEMQHLCTLLEDEGLLLAGIKKRKAVQARFKHLADTEGIKLRMTVEKRSKKGRPIDKKTGLEKPFMPQICTDSDACIESADPILIAFSEYVSAQKTFGAECEAYGRGTELPLHTRFEVLAATGRTTSSGQKVDGQQVGTNTQNVRSRPGVRECFVPRPGNAFICCDYDMAELRGLAQVCISTLGQSRLGEMLNDGADVHLEFASRMLHMSYEDTVKRYKKRKQNPDEPIEPRTGTPVIYNARQTGKVNNFGRPGGMGDAKLVFAARKQYGVVITVDESRALKRVWLDMLPEMPHYFRMINSWGRDNDYTVEHLWTNLLRSNIPYCAACNSPFQGLVATMMKNAGYLISHACYAEPDSPLYGCLVVNEVHDEIVVEAPIERIGLVAPEVKRLWVAGAAPYLPDVPPTASPVAMNVWSKNAEAVFSSAGAMVPWRLLGDYNEPTFDLNGTQIN